MNGGSHGLVFLFELAGGSWVETGILAPPNPFTDQLFGREVALDDGTLMVQEVRQDPVVAPEGGSAVHVYEWQAGAWVHTQKLSEPGYHDPGSFNNFGVSIDIRERFACIANFREDKVHLFEFDGAAWSSTDTITEANLLPFVPVPSVAFANRVEGDGQTLVIGASRAAGAAPVYILEHDGLTWRAVAELDSLPTGALPHAAGSAFHPERHFMPPDGSSRELTGAPGPWQRPSDR